MTTRRWAWVLDAVGVVLALVSGWQQAGDDLSWPFLLGAFVAFVAAEPLRRRSARDEGDAPDDTAAIDRAPRP